MEEELFVKTLSTFKKILGFLGFGESFSKDQQGRLSDEWQQDGTSNAIEAVMKS